MSDAKIDTNALAAAAGAAAGNTAKRAWGGLWNTILTLTPVVLTIVSTTLAGLSSSAMTQAMYYRSVAAQQQSKAGDQWGFFQAKRIRGTTMEMTAELLQIVAQAASFDPKELDRLRAVLVLLAEKATPVPANQIEIKKKLADWGPRLEKFLSSSTHRDAFNHLTTETLPKVKSEEIPEPLRGKLDKVVAALAQRRTDREIGVLVKPIAFGDIETLISLATEEAEAFDRAAAPVTAAIKEYRGLLKEFTEMAAGLRRMKEEAIVAFNEDLERLNKGFRMAIIDFEQRRYRHEALYNRRIAEMHEIEVRRSTVESDRHRERSSLFFYAMLAAQVGVTIGTLMLTRNHKFWLWFGATVAGLAAIGFAAFVYLTV